jgi:hypothetical protein
MNSDRDNSIFIKNTLKTVVLRHLHLGTFAQGQLKQVDESGNFRSFMYSDTVTFFK